MILFDWSRGWTPHSVFLACLFPSPWFQKHLAFSAPWVLVNRILKPRILKTRNRFVSQTGWAPVCLHALVIVLSPRPAHVCSRSQGQGLSSNPVIESWSWEWRRLAQHILDKNFLSGNFSTKIKQWWSNKASVVGWIWPQKLILKSLILRATYVALLGDGLFTGKSKWSY